MSKEIKKKSIFDKFESTVILAFLVYGVIPSDTNQFFVVSNLVLKYYCIIGFSVLAIYTVWCAVKSFSKIKENSETYLRLRSISDTLFLFGVSMVYGIIAMAITEILSLEVSFTMCGIPATLALVGLVLLAISEFKTPLYKKLSKRENHSN